jgi:hypothetical protein
VEVGLLPSRAQRGKDGPLTVTVSNHLGQAGSVRVRLKPPAGAKLTPDEVALDVPPNARAEATVTLVLDRNVALGEMQVPFTVSGTDARFNMDGSLALRVTEPVPEASIGRAAERPRIDGTLDEPLWQAAATVPELTMLAGGGPAAEKTAVWVAYDDSGLYVAFRCEESQMGGLQATLTERGAALYTEDDVELLLLPPGAPGAFQFAINALGTQSDNFGDRAEWAAAAERLGDAWTVEVFIPYAAIGVAATPGEGARWAAQFGRQEKPRGETTSWTPAAAFNAPERFGEIVFR